MLEAYGGMACLYPCTVRRMVEVERPRAASERPLHAAAGLHGLTRAVSTGPPVTNREAVHNFRDNGNYECNYESIESNQSNQAIMKLELAVRSIDQVLAKDISKLGFEPGSQREGRDGAVQYDSITVLPTVFLAELPPPPLPRTRSFRDAACRARTAHPWAREPGPGGARANSAPPVSPAVPRRR